MIIIRQNNGTRRRRRFWSACTYSYRFGERGSRRGVQRREKDGRIWYVGHTTAMRVCTPVWRDGWKWDGNHFRREIPARRRRRNRCPSGIHAAARLAWFVVFFFLSFFLSFFFFQSPTARARNCLFISSLLFFFFLHAPSLNRKSNGKIIIIQLPRDVGGPLLVLPLVLKKKHVLTILSLNIIPRARSRLGSHTRRV